MQVFAAFSLADSGSMKKSVDENYSGEYYETKQGAFFITTNGETTRQVATKIGLGDEPAGTGVVVPVTSYWGRHNRELWEWSSVKLNANGGQ